MLATAAVIAVVAAAPLKLAAVGFSQVGLSDAQAAFYAEHFATKLSEDPSVRLLTPKDLAAVIGIEKQKQLLGCAEQAASCMAELAGALGADGLVTGQVAKIGKSFQLNVKVIAGDGSRVLFVHSSKLLKAEEDLVEELNEVAPQAIARVRAQLSAGGSSAEAPSASVASSPSSGRPWARLLPGIAGLAAAVVGAVCLAGAQGNLSQLKDSSQWATLAPAVAQGYRDNGKTDLSVGIALAGVGVALVVAAVVWFLVGGS